MSGARIYYARTDEFWRKGEKYAYLEEKGHVGNVEWRELQPDAKNNWLREGRQDEYGQFLSIGNKETKDGLADSAIFIEYGRGIETTRDTWVYNFNQEELNSNIQRSINSYNEQVYKWQTQARQDESVDNFIAYDDKNIKWSRRLKDRLVSKELIRFNESAIHPSLYRPFATQFLYFDSSLVYLPALFPRIFPTDTSQIENQVVCVTAPGSEKPFISLSSNRLTDLHLTGAGSSTQCFPFYTYNEDGTNRRENVTDWVLEQFRSRYGDKAITKWDIFHYVYAVLHHPLYRERYAANLKRELPRIPYAPPRNFRAFADAGKTLAELHVNYEQQPEYPLERIEQSGVALNYRVERMKLSKDRRTLLYNDFLTLAGIPEETYFYRLGNRSALEWVIDQYQVTTDRRSQITNDPNRPEDTAYILRLVGQVVHVSLETVRVVRQLPELGVEQSGA
jgi:predicted helicase